MRNKINSVGSKIKSRVEADKKIYNLMKDRQATPEKENKNLLPIRTENNYMEAYLNSRQTIKDNRLNTSVHNDSFNNNLIIKNNFNPTASQHSYHGESGLLNSDGVLNETTQSNKSYYIEFDNEFRPQAIKDKALNSLQEGYMNSKLKDRYKNDSKLNENSNTRAIINNLELQYKNLDSRGNKVSSERFSSIPYGSGRDNSQMLSPHFNNNINYTQEQQTERQVHISVYESGEHGKTDCLIYRFNGTKYKSYV
jgi:hypothetical protein